MSIRIPLFYNNLKIIHTSGYVDSASLPPPNLMIQSLVFLTLSRIGFFFFFNVGLGNGYIQKLFWSYTLFKRDNIIKWLGKISTIYSCSNS